MIRAGGLIPKQSSPRCHETTCGRIIAEELGLPAAHVRVEEKDTDTLPYGHGTSASRSTPAAGAIAARKMRDKAAKIAVHLMEVGEEDLDWEPGQFSEKRVPATVTIQDSAFPTYTNLPEGMESGLEATNYYDPPNLTFPFGTYICVVEVDRGTGEVTVHRFVAVVDCGNIVNPIIVQRQVHWGLTQGLGESATVGAPPAIANAVVDTMAHLRATHLEIPK